MSHNHKKVAINMAIYGIGGKIWQKYGDQIVKSTGTYVKNAYNKLRPKEQKILWWSYQQVRSNNKVGHAHHVPSNSVTPFSTNKWPSILMSIEDHKLTWSFWQLTQSKNYRKIEENLIKEWKIEEAFEMWVKDIQSKFWNKYDEWIAQMREYFYNNLLKK